MANHRKKKGDLSQVHVVVERREHVDREMLSVALFAWLMEKLRAESTGGKHRAAGHQTTTMTQRTEAAHELLPNNLGGPTPGMYSRKEHGARDSTIRS